MRVVSFWEEKSFFEKCFWYCFVIGVLLFLFYHFRLEPFLSSYHEHIPMQKQEMVSMHQASAFEILNTIVESSKGVEIEALDFKNHQATIKVNGDFDALMQWFYMVENFKQNKILDFKIFENNGLNLEILLEIME